MSRNRIEFIKDSVDSLINQTYPNLRIIISDNSTTEMVVQFIEATYPHLEIRKRRSNYSSYDHLNEVWSEVRAPFFMIFHDDDILSPSYVARMIDEIERDPTLAAVCSNANLIYGNKISSERFNSTLKESITIRNTTKIIQCYLNFSIGVNPFPGYLYRYHLISDLRFDISEGGQYTDITFLTKVIRRGPIRWIAEPLMWYRKHGANHSASVSLVSAKKTLRYLNSEGLLDARSELATLFRYWNHLFFIKNRSARLRVRRTQVLAVARYFLTHPQSLVLRVSQKISASLRKLFN